MTNLKENPSSASDMADLIRDRLAKEKNIHQDGGGTLGEIATLKSLNKKESISENKNGTYKDESKVDSPPEKLPKRPGSNGKSGYGNASAIQNGTQENKSKKLPSRPSQPEESEQTSSKNKEKVLGNLSEMVDLGDVVWPTGEADETLSEKENFWFLKEIIKDEDGEETLHLVYKDKDGYEVGSLGSSWEKITPRFEDAESYINKLQSIQEEITRAKENGDKYRQDKLGDLLYQVRHFALIFRNKINS